MRVCFVFIVVVLHLFFVLRCSLSSVTRFRTTIRVGFFVAAHIVQLFLSGSHVFTKAVHLNAIHRFAGAVRGRGGNHLVDRVASNDSSCFPEGGAVMFCAWCPRASFVSSVSVPCVFLSAARGQLEHEAQVRSHLVEVHVCSDE